MKKTQEDVTHTETQETKKDREHVQGLCSAYTMASKAANAELTHNKMHDFNSSPSSP